MVYQSAAGGVAAYVGELVREGEATGQDKAKQIDGGFHSRGTITYEKGIREKLLRFPKESRLATRELNYNAPGVGHDPAQRGLTESKPPIAWRWIRRENGLVSEAA